jgi:hypothetical protein
MSHDMPKTRPRGGIPDAKRPPKPKRFRALPRYYVTASKVGRWRLVIWNSVS